MNLDQDVGVDLDAEVVVDVNVDSLDTIIVNVQEQIDIHLSEETMEMNQTQKAISHTFDTTARLAAFLPAASVLVFQLLSPLLSTLGTATTAALVAFCGVVSTLSCFTDTVIDRKGNVCHGIATFGGFWILDGTSEKGLAPEVKTKYKVKLLFPSKRHPIGFPLPLRRRN